MILRDALLQTINSARREFSPYKLLYEQLVHLPLNRPIYVYALGKAAYQMTEAVLFHAQQEQFIRIMGGLVITHYGNVKEPLPRIAIMEAGHPIPDDNSLAAGVATINFLHKLNENDILLVLLSGGGSALMEKPAEGVSFEQIVNTTRDLLKNGANIETINDVRKKLSAVKGGKLLRHIRSKFIFIYAMSDVPGDKPKYIASNPFLPDAEKTEDKMSVENFHRFDRLTSRRSLPMDKAIVYKIIANNHAFCEVVKSASLEFFRNLQADRVHLISTDLSGEASKTGREIADLAGLIDKQRGKGHASFETPCLLVFGGETFVNVVGTGVGGRCTELALAAVEGLSALNNCALLAYATDGKDGLCEAAGAIVDSHSKQALLDKGIDIKASLANNDSYTSLKEIGAIIPNEFTGINVNDIVLLYVH
jgi:glycerate 2-kinase